MFVSYLKLLAIGLPAFLFDLQNLQLAQQAFETCQDAREKGLLNQLYDYFFPPNESVFFSLNFMSRKEAAEESCKTGKCFFYQTKCLTYPGKIKALAYYECPHNCTSKLKQKRKHRRKN